MSRDPAEMVVMGQTSWFSRARTQKKSIAKVLITRYLEKIKGLASLCTRKVFTRAEWVSTRDLFLLLLSRARELPVALVQT